MRNEDEIRRRIDAAMANQACTRMLNEKPYNDPELCSTEEELNARCLQQLAIDEAVRVSNAPRRGDKIIYHNFRR